MKKKICPSQKVAMAEWIRRIRPGRNYLISEVFSNQEADSTPIHAMQHLIMALLKPGVPSGNPQEAD